MNHRIRYCLFFCIAAIALPSPCDAQWVFTSVKSSFFGLPGAKGNGIDDDTLPINRAISSGNVIYFPPGRYRYVGPMTLPANQSFRLYGDGPGTSTIVFESSLANAGINAPNMGLSTLNVDGLTLAAKSANCGTAIYAAFSESGSSTKFRTATIQNVEIVGDPIAGGNYWTKGIDLFQAQNAVIDKIDITGNYSPPGGTLVGITWRSSSTYKTTGLLATNLEVKFVQTALQTSGWVDGVYLTGFELVFCSRQGFPVVDLSATAPAGVQKSTFQLVNGHIQGLGDGIRLTNLNGVKISKVLFLHNAAPISGCSMVEFNGCTDAVVSNCSFLGAYFGGGLANENGIILNNSQSVRIAENSFSDFNAATGSCIVVGWTSNAVRITNNLFSSFSLGVGGVAQPYEDAALDTYYRGNNL